MERVEHQAISDGKPFEGSGKDKGLVNPPIVSVNPTSKAWNKPGVPEGDKHYKVFDVGPELFSHKSEKVEDGYFPFETLNLGQAFFIEAKDQTTDKLLETMYRQIWHVKQEYAEPERNENGDPILDQVIIDVRKKNEDGTFQLESDGKITKGANSTYLPRMVYARNFIAKAVVKDDEVGKGFNAPADGVAIIRVW